MKSFVRLACLSLILVAACDVRPRTATSRMADGIVHQPTVDWKQEAVLDHVTVSIDRERSAIVIPTLLDFAGQVQHGKSERLVIVVRIRNLSAAKKVTYRSWRMALMGDGGSSCAGLTDDLGNNYQVIWYPGKPVIDGDTKQATPGEDVYDTIIFEKPIARARKLTLTLSAGHVDMEGEFRLTLPARLKD